MPVNERRRHTCLATAIPRPLPADVPAAVVAQTLAGSPAEVPGTLVVAGGECPTLLRLDAGTGPVDASVAALPSARLDVYIPFPGNARTLLLAFTTTVPEPAQEAMVMLFEAMAESLRWNTQPCGGSVREPQPAACPVRVGQ